MVLPVRVQSVRPLVRYVDRHQAVIDTHFVARMGLDERGRAPSPEAPGAAVEVLVELNGSDGFHDEGETRMRLDQGRGAIRFEVVYPDRWWPAGMGKQALYELRIGLVVKDELVDHQSITFGLASIRREPRYDVGPTPSLLVNGEVIDVQDVIIIDRVDERGLLPVAGASVLLVRDHYGPQLLYDAADRAGILLIQCVPVDEHGATDETVEQQVNRLAVHPSLAGYYVGHLGDRRDQVAAQIRRVDPTRPIFTSFPLDGLE